MAKLFLTNATGYIGAAIAKVAREAGHEVTALARSEESAARLQEFGVKPHRGDLRQPESFKEAIKQFDVVIHTAADYSGDFAGSDKKTVDAVIEAFKGTNKQFIYTSGIWVLGNTVDTPATEETPTEPIPGLEWRVEHERKVIDANTQGIKAIVVRPGLVYGNNGGYFAQQYAQAKKVGELTYVGDGNNRFALVHIDDVARFYVLAVEKAAANAVFHVTSGKTVKQREAVELVAQQAGIPGKVRSLPLPEARKTLGLYADGLSRDQDVQSPAAKKVLGWEPKAPELKQELAQKQPAAAR